MAPYNNSGYGSGSRYDPVGSQYNQQHEQGYTYPPTQQQRPSAPASYLEPSTSSSTYQTPYTTAYPHGSGNSYYNNWTNAAPQQSQPNTTEDRAAKTLSHLAAQDQAAAATASSSSRTTSQYAQCDTSYHNPTMTSTQPSTTPSQQRATSNQSPVYQPARTSRQTSRQTASASTYPSGATYATANSTYQYPSYGNSAQAQPSAIPQAATRPSHSPATTYQYPSTATIPKPPTPHQSFRPASPFVVQQQAQQQQAQQQQQTQVHSQAQAQTHAPQQPKARKERPSTAKSSTAAAAAAQNNARDHRSANVGQPRAPSVTPSSIQQQQHSCGQQRQSSASEASAPTTVDPSQVYDPWPEQQRRIREAEARRKVEAEEKARKETEERRVVEAAEAKRKAEEAEKQRIVDEQRAAEEAQDQLQEEQHRAMETASRAQVEGAAPHPDDVASVASAGGVPPGSDMEAEMLAMFKEMREFNEKNPAMLARLWDQERRAHIAKTSSPASASPAQPVAPQRPPNPPPTARPPPPSNPPSSQRAPLTSKPPPPARAPPPAHPHPASSMPPKPLPTRTPPAGNRSINATGPPRSNAAPPSTAAPPASPLPGPSAPSASTAAQPAGLPLTSVPGTNAIWPPGKKAQLAEVAAKWLSARPENAGKHVTGDRVISLLNSNPSYMALCDMLEKQMGLFVERAAFARALLSAVPDVNRHHAGAPPVSSSRPMINSASIAAAASLPASPIAENTSSVLANGPPTKKRKTANLGKFGDVRGRPKKDAIPTEPKLNKDGTPRGTGNGKQMETKQQASSSKVVDLTESVFGSAPGSATPTSAPPPVMYQHALAGNGSTVVYETGVQFNAPPGDHYQAPAEPPARRTAPRPVFATPQQAAYSSPYFRQAADAHTPSQQPPGGQQNGPPRPTPSQGPPRPPANKEEAARKRNFSELVDLTALDDDSDEEEHGPHPSHPNYGQLAGPGTSTVSAGHASSGPSFVGRPFNHYTYNGTISNNYVPGVAPQAPMQAPVQAPTQTPMQAAPLTSIQPDIMNLESELKNQILVEGIHRDKVARKSHYDPRTICRDVLLATGRHPEMRALNQHLFDMHDFLKRHSVNIDGDKFDLSSIRWDLIDPGEPVVEAKPDEDKASEVATDADDEDDEKIDRSENHSKKISGRLVTAKLAHRRKPFSKKAIGRPRGIRKSMPNFGSRAMHEDGGESSDQPSGPQSNATAPTTATSDVNARGSQTPGPPVNSFTPVNRATARMSGTPSSAPIGYAAFNQANTQYDADGKPIKRKGRPVGWRKSIHSKAAVAGEFVAQAAPALSKRRAAQTGPNYTEVKRRGRPAKATMLATPARDPSPAFNVYKCQWEGCKAELHNLDTLRKHVVKLHGKKGSDGDFECFWEDCFQDTTGPENIGYYYNQMGEWLEHVETTHIKPLARKLGDGPRVGLSGSASPVVVVVVA